MTEAGTPTRSDRVYAHIADEALTHLEHHLDPDMTVDELIVTLHAIARELSDLTYAEDD